MSADRTARLGLPYLIASQAQKEMTHNEALTLLDLLVQPVIKARLNAPPATPKDGDAYIVTATATDSWLAKEKQIAWYVGGVWRFVAPYEGMWFWSAADARDYVYHESDWIAK